jgi:quercetin dioxygenase-like cupin family protein
MSITKFVSLSVCLLALTLQSKAAPNDPPKLTPNTAPKSTPPEAKVEELMSKDLPDFPGKEGLMITVVYPPGSQDPIHRHNADAFVYVLEGSIVMQVKGGKEVTLTADQTFYEGPNDVHTVGRNASQTEPAKFVVFLVKNKNAPVLIPVK